MVAGERVEDSTKGDRSRVLSIDAGTVAVMCEHRSRQAAERLAVSSDWAGNVVAARLGHADPAVTLRVYAHVLREQAAGVADVFAQAVSKGVSTGRRRRNVS